MPKHYAYRVTLAPLGTSFLCANSCLKTQNGKSMSKNLGNLKIDAKTIGPRIYRELMTGL